MAGFEKIDLTTKIPNKQQPNRGQTDFFADKGTMKKKHTKRNSTLLIIIFVIVVLGLFVVFGIVMPALKVVVQAKATYAQAKLVATAAKQQNAALASDELNKTNTDLLQTQQALHTMGYVQFIPIVNWYYNDADHLIQAGLYALQGGRSLVDSVLPYADLLGLKGQGSFVGGSASQRIQTAVTTFSKVAPNIDKISGSLGKMKQELDQVEPNHYPPLFGGEKVRSYLSQAKTLANDADIFVSEATPLIKVLPDQLGEPTEKHYMLLFQNDKELRPTGGFITAYAILRLDEGIIHADSSNDIYTLDATVPNKPVAPDPILKYLPKVPLWNLRDTNLSPDFISSMNDFNKLYKTAGGYTKVDGIIAVDTYPLLDAINILGGSITVDGTTFTTQKDPRCECANVIYQLEVAADQPTEYVKTNRKGLVGDLMLAIMNKAFSSSPKVYWGPLFQTMLTNVAQKHILFDVYNADAQSGLDALNASGRIKPFDGDYLHINEANFGGDKANLFVSEAVTQNYDIKSDGTITKTVTISYKNPYPPSDCNLEHGQLCLNADFRDWIRLYVPKGSYLVSSQGSEVKMSTYDDLGKTVFDGFLTVRPEGATTFTITYNLPFKLANGSPLPALYQKQPGTGNSIYTINVNGHQQDQFPLDTDKTIKINQ